MKLCYQGACYEVTQFNQLAQRRKVISNSITLTYRGNQYQLYSQATGNHPFTAQAQTVSQKVAAAKRLLTYRGATYTL